MHLPTRPLSLLTLLVFGASSAPPAIAALSLTTLNSPVEFSFNDFTAPAVWASTTPSPGQLDSDLWAMATDGPLATTPATFGVDQSGGMGTSTGSESATGVYAFDVGGGEIALGVQPTGTYWTPGMFTLRLKNDTGTTLNTLRVEWTGWVFNDQGRSNDLQFLHSADNTTFLSAGPEFSLLSPAAPSPAPVTWTATPKDITLANLALAPGAEYYLRWGGDDIEGTGSRDEFALGGVRITPVPEPTTLVLLLLGALTLIRPRR